MHQVHRQVKRDNGEELEKEEVTFITESGPDPALMQDFMAFPELGSEFEDSSEGSLSNDDTTSGSDSECNYDSNWD